MQSAIGRNRRRPLCARWLGWAVAAWLLSSGAVPAMAQGGAAYLKLGVGARALGMGGAFTAVADDATALFWNPAGVARLQKQEVTGMHAQLSLDRNYDFVGFARPTEDKSGGWGVGYTRFSITGIPETRVRPGTTLPQLTDDAYDAAGNFTGAGPGLGQVRIFSLFDDVEQNVSGSYGRKVGDRLYLGGSVRYLKQSLFTADGSGFGFDLGGLYVASDDWTLGFAAKDLAESIEFGGGLQDADVDSTFSAGAAYKGIKNTLVSVETTRTGDQGLKLRAGAERWFDDKYAVRAGTNRGNVSAGASLRFNDWQFDYAYQSQDLGDIQRLSFVYRF